VNDGNTRMFAAGPQEDRPVRECLMQVEAALREKGYNPVVQIVGYLLSGDPAYITAHRNARALIRQLPRDEILEELVRHYLER
jgi:uncharacterized protein (UPF0297 family)